VRIRLLSPGHRPPDWVRSGYEDYARRMQGRWQLELVEMPPGRRRRGQKPDQAIQDEGRRLLAIHEPGRCLVALDMQGRSLTSEKMAHRLQDIELRYGHLDIVMGGPDGLCPTVLNEADEIWSLSGLTFAHPLVRVLMAEQLYRCWSLTTGHPYHR
jgi:23S rRNA (pseudouridine1915-N3)-methyltransferase